MEFRKVQNGDISLNVAVKGGGPVVLFVHGFPELWFSFRHQLQLLAGEGFTAAALDVRGYGGSDKPEPIEAYAMRVLCSDVAAVAAALSDEPVVLVGHDWGAPIAWHTALLHPDRVRAVVGMSVPYFPGTGRDSLEMFDKLHEGRFFYQLYFQQEGVAEAELEGDLKESLRKMYFGCSGATPIQLLEIDKPRDSRLFDGFEVDDLTLEWLSEDELQVYVDAFAEGGMRGPLNRYRAGRLDADDLVELRGKKIAQPAAFIAGERDTVRNFVPGTDLFAAAGAGCEDFRGSTIVDGAGHWVQQEAPAETNAALLAFLRGL